MLRCVSRLLGKSKAARAEDEATADMEKKKVVHPYSQHIPQILKLHIFAESIKSWKKLLVAGPKTRKFTLSCLRRKYFDLCSQNGSNFDMFVCDTRD